MYEKWWENTVRFFLNVNHKHNVRFRYQHRSKVLFTFININSIIMWILFECISKIYDSVLTYPFLDFNYYSYLNWPLLNWRALTNFFCPLLNKYAMAYWPLSTSMLFLTYSVISDLTSWVICLISQFVVPKPTYASLLLFFT